MNRIAIIPARSGSKGLPDKNIKELNGKPLMAYTIEAAIESGLFTKIHVSTDSERYAEIAQKYGAEVPFLRSQDASSDTASSWEAVKEVLLRYEKIEEIFSECMLLQPTSPRRDSKEIINAYEVFANHRADSVVSVCEVEHPIEWCFTLREDLSMDEFDKNPYKNMRRQELNRNFRENGAIYILKTTKLKDKAFNFYGPNCFAYIMDRSKSIDIDNAFDFKIAEIIMHEALAGSNSMS